MRADSYGLECACAVEAKSRRVYAKIQRAKNYYVWQAQRKIKSRIGQQKTIFVVESDHSMRMLPDDLEIND